MTLYKYYILYKNMTQCLWVPTVYSFSPHIQTYHDSSQASTYTNSASSSWQTGLRCVIKIILSLSTSSSWVNTRNAELGGPASLSLTPSTITHNHTHTHTHTDIYVYKTYLSIINIRLERRARVTSSSLFHAFWSRFCPFTTVILSLTTWCCFRLGSSFGYVRCVVYVLFAENIVPWSRVHVWVSWPVLVLWFVHTFVYVCMHVLHLLIQSDLCV